MRVPAPRALRTVALASLAVVLAIGAATVAAPPRAAADPDPRPPRPRWTYRVTPSADLATLAIRWCLTDFVPRRAWLVDVLPLDAIRLGASRGGRLVPDPKDPPILVADGVAGDACFEYTVDVAKVVAAGAGRRDGRTVTLRIGAFLLRAGFTPDDLDATIEFAMPEGLAVAAPWPSIGPSTYRVEPSTWAFQGYVVLGPLERRPFVAAGCEVDLLLYEGALACSVAGVQGWLGRAIETDALLFGGRFPRRRLLVGVEPVRASSDPVPFGSAWSGGGAHAFLLVAANCLDEDFADDWTATHELLHTALPHVAIEDAWCGEGFVTYYQEVLRARAGVQSPLEAWQALHEGFGRGRRSASTHPIADDSARMHERHEYWRVYWAGAALALLLDVDARAASGGRVTLDDAMRAAVAHPAADRRSLTGREIVAELDRRLGSPRATAIVERVLAGTAFPDVAATFSSLGLTVADDRVALAAQAPGAAIRDAIMAPAAPAAAAASGSPPPGR